MPDFKDLRHGKDQNHREGTTINGVYYTNFALLKALAKALIKNEAVTLAEIKDEL